MRQRDAIRLSHEKLGNLDARLHKSARETLVARASRLDSIGKLLESVSYRRVLARGYALVRDINGVPLHGADEVGSGQALLIQFTDGLVGVTADGARPARKRTAKPRDAAEPSLFE